MSPENTYPLAQKNVVPANPPCCGTMFFQVKPPFTEVIGGISHVYISSGYAS